MKNNSAVVAFTEEINADSSYDLLEIEPEHEIKATPIKNVMLDFLFCYFKMHREIAGISVFLGCWCIFIVLMRKYQYTSEFMSPSEPAAFWSFCIFTSIRQNEH